MCIRDRSKPSLSSVDFLKRIQDKCKYEPTVYLVAMFLIEMLFLTRNKNGDDGLQLKRKLKEKEVHRVIIAAVRLSTKLLEDYVHSVSYTHLDVYKRQITHHQLLKTSSLSIFLFFLNPI